MANVDDLLSCLDLESFFLQFVSDKRRIGNELLTNCPFHSDNHASMSINLKTGLWRCHTVSCPHHSGGNAIQFYAFIKGLTFEAATAELYGKYKEDLERLHKKEKGLYEQQITSNHERLLRNQAALNYLKESCGYKDETIERFKLGFDGERYWIPIIEAGTVVNIRKYSPTDQIKMKGLPGSNEARLWPFENLQGNPIYLFEGEKDCILANQCGLNGVTVTGGAGTWKAEWVALFKQKDVVICYDIDDAGRKGAKKVVDFLQGIVRSIKDVNLPLTTPANADFTDYIVHAEYTKDDFDTLVEETPFLENTETSKPQISKEIYDVELSDASKKDYFYKRVKMKTIIVGKDLAPYLVPKRLRIHCLMGKKICPYCGIGMQGGDFDLVFNEEAPEILQLINCTDMQQERCIREKLCVYGNCRQYSYSVAEAQNIEEVKLIPEIKYSSDVREYVIRTGYYLGHGVKTNQSYEIEGITIPHPQTQYATHIIYATRESEMSVEKFELTDEIIKGLCDFQCALTI